jgi:hypothetical protein
VAVVVDLANLSRKKVCSVLPFTIGTAGIIANSDRNCRSPRWPSPVVAFASQEP